MSALRGKADISVTSAIGQKQTLAERLKTPKEGLSRILANLRNGIFRARLGDSFLIFAQKRSLEMANYLMHPSHCVAYLLQSNIHPRRGTINTPTIDTNRLHGAADNLSRRAETFRDF